MKKIKIQIILLSILSLLLISCNMVIYSKLFDTASTVLYNDNNSTSGVIPSGPVVYSPGNVITVLGNTGALQKTGFTFMGWNTARDGSGSTYTAGQTFTIGKTSVRLYALWQASITFDANGGTGAMPLLAINYNASRTLLPNSFTRANFHFIGWNTVAAAAIAEYNDESAYLMENGDDTLYAIWSGDNYAITFNANGATAGTMGDQSIAFGATSNINPNLFSRTGYNFYGWTVTSGSTTRDYMDNDLYTMSSAGATLYAIWIGTITFDKNAVDATGTMANQTIYYNVPAALNANSYLRAGYSFAGWNTIDSGSGTSFVNSAAYDLDLGSCTLYVQWSGNTYTVTYDNEASTHATQNVTVPASTVGVLPGDPVRTGYTFSGWWTGPNGTGTQFIGSTPVNSNITVYAYWIINQYTVEYNGNGNTAGSVPAAPANYNYNSSITAPDNTGDLRGQLIQDGITQRFTGWNTAADGSGTSYPVGSPITIGAANITLYAQWTTTLTVIGKIGPAGGYVFYDDAVDTYPGWRYMEVSPVNVSTSAEYGCWGISVGTTSRNIGTGKENTDLILLACPAATTGAYACSNYTLNGYADWFLPSYYELLEINTQIQNNGLAGTWVNSYYWSSSQYEAGNVLYGGYGYNLVTNIEEGPSKGDMYPIRAARRF